MSDADLRKRTLRTSIWPAVLIATIVLLARGAMIAAHQSERFDDEYHLNRGIAFLRGAVGDRALNDPPLGEAIGALPLLVTGSYNADPAIDMGIYGHRLSPERLLLLVALWKSLLLVPMVAVAFAWARALYGLRSAWLATALLLVEPTIAAHAPLPAVDVIGMEGIVVACFATWRYVERPSAGRAIFAAFAIALGMLLKNTAMILPGVAAVVVAIGWLRRGGDGPSCAGMTRVGHVAIAIAVGLLSLWALSRFDVSVPLRQPDVPPGALAGLAPLLRTPWPAGVYVRSVLAGLSHVSNGHAAFLDGVKYFGGRWRYFPIVASYKLPVGVMAALLLGVASFAWRRLRFAEWSLAAPLAIYLASLLGTQINIGFRHFLPVVALALIFASRTLASGGAQFASGGAQFATRSVIAAACCALALVETLRVHPNYLSFTNALRGPPWLKISDSNLDWGQSLPALRAWADARAHGRPIRFAYFGWELPYPREHWLAGSRIETVFRPNYNEPQPGPLPTRGLFVVSAAALSGAYDKSDRLRPLWSATPIEVIDGCLLVYDLDRIKPRVHWPAILPPRKPPKSRAANRPPTTPTKAERRRATTAPTTRPGE